jgi:hypothetical protein
VLFPLDLLKKMDRHLGPMIHKLHAKYVIGRNKMKQLFLVGISLLAVAACAPEPSPPPAAALAPAAAGSPAIVTTAFDGTYDGSFVQNISVGTTGAQCPNYRVAPALTIRNGVARFAALDLTFQGSVTPQGALSMQASTGQTFVGQIDPYYVLKGRVTGNCVYDATWQRKGATGQKPS